LRSGSGGGVSSSPTSSGFLSPRSQLAYIYQERALGLWRSLVERLAPDHPLREVAQETLEGLSRMTPKRPLVGLRRVSAGQ
jgi:hypothetical protein